MIITREVVDEIARKSEENYDFQADDDWHTDFANAIAEYVQANPEWVKCIAQKPENTGWYLVASESGQVRMDCFNVGNGWWSNTDKAKYWMPLPAVPKGD